jgi:tetratricopeptide (TPR) repeat protein
LARNKLGQTDRAIADLERSLEYLPTAPAHFTLGKIKEERGLTDDAIEHYKVVAKSDSEYGKAANAALVRLELSSQPASYISSACGDDGGGRIVVRVRNDTGVPVRAVQVRFQYVDSGGDQRQRTQSFSGQIAPGKVASVKTGLAPYAGSRCSAAVISAQIVE